MNRRRFLQGVAVAGTVGLAGCPTLGDDGNEEATSTSGRRSARRRDGTPRETRTTPSRPATAVDAAAMTEVTADVSGGDGVADAVDAIGSGDLLAFPPGRFTWESRATVTADDWGIRCHEDTVFEVPAGVGDGEKFGLLKTHAGGSTADNVLLENLTFDSPGRAAPAIYLDVRNNAYVDGLRYEMDGPLSNRLQENGLQAHVENDDGVILVDDYRQFNNGDLGAYGRGNSRIGIWVGPKNEGTVHLRNPVLQGFPNNACYVSRQPGTVVVEGGRLVNNNVSAVRVSGGVEVRGTTIVIDVDRYLRGPGTLDASSHIARGIWGDNRGAGTDGGLVTGATFVLRSYRTCHGLATILENPRVTVRDSQFLLGDDIVSVQVDTGEMVVSNCVFTGESRGSTAGVGAITGSGNHVVSTIDPGDVPVERWDGTWFERPATGAGSKRPTAGN